jgi:hypothetical protein
MIVGQSMQHYQRIAAGLSIPASVSSGFAVTQGVWRFLANQHIPPQLLVAPLRQFAQQQINGGYVLHVFDWCKLDDKNHVPQADRISDCLKDSHGYDFTAQLAVNADNGSPIALWYYYRWRIESYFKLLKSGGQEIEHWQQESGLAILKRLLVVSMAYSIV